MNIKDGVFLITGAGSGLGAAVARMVVGDGGKAVLLDVNEDAGASLAHELGAAARFVKTDVTSEADGQAAVAAAHDAFGRIDALVNCAGVAPGEKVVGREGPHSLDRFARAVSINLIGTFNMIRLAADAMSKQDANAEDERGVIVNTASVAAFDGQIGQAAYAASKSGVVGMTLPIARELALRHSRGDDRAGHLRDADDGRHAAGCAGRARQERAVSAAARPPGRIRGAGAPYRRQYDAER
jgi:NAD(P)-dependent dehydrogenase (short-subunit alcohol dehydrogenase family)